MAKVTKGSFNTTAYNNRYLTFTWENKVQTVVSNYTVINWKVVGAGSATGFFKAGNFKIVIDGETVFNSSTRIELYNGTVVASGEKVISHNANGSRSFSASVEAAIYYYDVNSTGGGSWDLVDIPRAATITAAPNFHDEENPAISYNNPAGNAVDSLQACVSFEDNTILLAYRDIPKTGNVYTFFLTDAERATLRNSLTTSTSAKVRFYVRTLIGGNYYYSYLTKTLTIVNAAPTLAPTIEDVNSLAKDLTGDKNKLIKYISNASVSAGAAALKGASIKSVKITCGSKSLAAASGTINAVESGSFVFTVTDSRGVISTQTVDKTLINYVKPTCSIKSAKLGTDGVLNITIEGNIYNGSFGAKNNTIFLQYQYTEAGGETSGLLPVEATLDGNRYTANVSVSGLNYRKYYQIKARIIDTYINNGYPEITQPIEAKPVEVRAIPVYSWGKEDFKHETIVKFAHAMPIYGTMADGTEVIVLDPQSSGGNVGLGYGNYLEQKGNTNIYAGVDINLNPRGALKIAGSPLADYVVESGSGGIWRYRKWNSGLAECFGVSTITTDVKCSYGSGYLCSDGTTAKALSAYFPTGLFKSVIVADASANHVGKVMLTTGSGFTNEKMNYYIFTPNNVSYTGLSITVHFHAVGTWK